jgi:hypothetical protein
MGFVDAADGAFDNEGVAEHGDVGIEDGGLLGIEAFGDGAPEFQDLAASKLDGLMEDGNLFVDFVGVDLLFLGFGAMRLEDVGWSKNDTA